MQKNIGSADKVIRIFLGIAIIILGIIFKSWWGIVGIIPLFTALVEICPIYLPFKISTKKKEQVQ